MSRASETLLDSLHGATAEAYAEEIRKYRDGEYTDGEGRTLPIPASLLANAAKFLKDNGVDTPGRDNEKIDELAGSMPEFDDVKAGAYPH